MTTTPVTRRHLIPGRLSLALAALLLVAGLALFAHRRRPEPAGKTADHAPAPARAETPTRAGHPLEIRLGAARRRSAAAAGPDTRADEPAVPSDRPVARLLVAPNADTRENILLAIIAEGNTHLSDLRAAITGADSVADLELFFRALAAIGTPESIALFKAFLDEDANHPLREYLARQLASLESRAAAPLVLDWLVASTNYDITIAAVECVQRLADASLLAAWQAAYDRPDSSDFQREYLRAVLPELRDPAAAPRLAGLLDRADDPALREAAAAGLAHIGSREAVETLIARIEKETELAPDHYLITALGAVQNKDLRPLLAARFETETDPKVKYGLGLALAGLVRQDSPGEPMSE